MEENVGGVRGVAWCLVVGLGACGLLRAFRGRGLGVAAGPCFAGLSAARGAATLVAPLQRSGGCVVAWSPGLILVRVAVSVLRLWAECPGQGGGLCVALTDRRWPPRRTRGRLRLRLP